MDPDLFRDPAVPWTESHESVEVAVQFNFPSPVFWSVRVEGPGVGPTSGALIVSVAGVSLIVGIGAAGDARAPSEAPAQRMKRTRMRGRFMGPPRRVRVVEDRRRRP